MTFRLFAASILRFFCCSSQISDSVTMMLLPSLDETRFKVGAMVRDGLGFILLRWTLTFDTVVNNGVIGVELRCGSLSSRGATFPNADNLLLQHQTAVETTIHEVPLLRFCWSLLCCVRCRWTMDASKIHCFVATMPHQAPASTQESVVVRTPV